MVYNAVLYKYNTNMKNIHNITHDVPNTEITATQSTQMDLILQKS